MVLFSVSGACSRAGKTTLAETLLRQLPGQSAVAVKFTTTEGVFHGCPRGKTCTVCAIDAPYRIIEDRQRLSEPGTDTARLLNAGALDVVWAIAKRDAVADAWRDVQKRLKGVAVVVVEGSTIVSFIRPDHRLFVVHPFLAPSRWKSSTASLVSGADVVVINRFPGAFRAPSAAVWASLRRLRGRDDLRRADVRSDLRSWAPETAARLLRSNVEVARRRPSPRTLRF